VYIFGGTDLEKIGESASAEGVKLRLPKARSPSRLGGLGECRKLSGVWAPDADATFNILCQNGVHFWIHVNLRFLAIKLKK